MSLGGDCTCEGGNPGYSQKKITWVAIFREDVGRMSLREETSQEELLLEATLGRLFQEIHNLLSKTFDSRVKHLGLTRSQWRALSPLMQQDGLTQTELAEILAIEKAPLGRTLDKLDATGWIVRKTDPMDRRARRVFLTEKIDPHIPELKAAMEDVFRNALKGFSANDVETLIRLMMTMKANIQNSS